MVQKKFDPTPSLNRVILSPLVVGILVNLFLNRFNIIIQQQKYIHVLANLILTKKY